MLLVDGGVEVELHWNLECPESSFPCRVKRELEREREIQDGILEGIVEEQVSGS